MKSPCVVEWSATLCGSNGDQKVTEMNRFLRRLAIVMGLVLVAGACGDDDGGSAASTDDPLVQAIVDEMLADETNPAASRDEAECFASGVVGAIGTDRLNELGVTPDDVGSLDEIGFERAEVEVVVDEMFDCTSAAEEFVNQFSVDGMSDEDAACLADAFGEDKLKEFMVSAFLDEEPSDLFATITTAMNDCGIDPLAG